MWDRFSVPLFLNIQKRRRVVSIQLAPTIFDRFRVGKTCGGARACLGQRDRIAFIIGMDSHGCITHWNAQAEAVFGWKRTEAVGHKPIDKGLIHKLLLNRTYLGELRHQEQWYPGEYLPIIDHKLVDDVQAILSINYRVRAGLNRGGVDFLLKGIVFGNDDRALSPTELEVRLCANGLEKMVLESQAEHSHVKCEEVAA